MASLEHLILTQAAHLAVVCRKQQLVLHSKLCDTSCGPLLDAALSPQVIHQSAPMSPLTHGCNDELLPCRVCWLVSKPGHQLCSSSSLTRAMQRLLQPARWRLSVHIQTCRSTSCKGFVMTSQPMPWLALRWCCKFARCQQSSLQDYSTAWTWSLVSHCVI